jgi:hypothetical protein
MIATHPFETARESVLSSLLLFLMLCSVVLLLFMRRRQHKRPSSGPSSWSCLPGSRVKVKRIPSSQVLLSGPSLSRGEDHEKSRFGLAGAGR